MSKLEEMKEYKPQEIEVFNTETDKYENTSLVMVEENDWGWLMEQADKVENLSKEIIRLNSIIGKYAIPQEKISHVMSKKSGTQLSANQWFDYK